MMATRIGVPLPDSPTCVGLTAVALEPVQLTHFAAWRQYAPVSVAPSPGSAPRVPAEPFEHITPQGDAHTLLGAIAAAHLASAGRSALVRRPPVVKGERAVP